MKLTYPNNLIEAIKMLDKSNNIADTIAYTTYIRKECERYIKGCDDILSLCYNNLEITHLRKKD